jgi:iron(III) transport system substrate-binding protein
MVRWLSRSRALKRNCKSKESIPMSCCRIIIVIFFLTLTLSACGQATQPEAPDPAVVQTEVVREILGKIETPGFETSGRLVIYSGRSEPLIQPVIDAFKAKYPGVDILLKAGSNSEIANALIEEQVNPQADIFITTELFTIQSLAAQGIFQPYLPAGAENLPVEFADPEHQWIGLTLRVRIIIYNTELISPDEVPKSIFDLTQAKWKGQVATAGSTNGSMQAQIAVMRQLIGEQPTAQWLSDLISNQVTFFGGHTDVRKAVGAGEFKLGLVNHYYFYLQQAEGSPVGIVFPDQGEDQIGLITNATAAAVVKDARNASAAQEFLDFLISPEGQKLFAELNYEYPLLSSVELRQGVQPLDGLRLADGNSAKAALEFEATFDLMDKVGLP